MNDPLSVEEFRSMYFEYFSHLFNQTRKISFRGRQVDCLLYSVKHPISSAYDIKPGRKLNASDYTWAKITLRQLHKLGLIQSIKSGQKNEKHGSIKYLLTDAGILYLIGNTRLPYRMLLQELFKNYHNSNIFQYLIYPFIKLETLCSPKMKLYLIAGVGNFLISILQKMDHTLELLEKGGRSNREIYSWNYDELEEYLKRKYHYDFLDITYTEEDDDDDYKTLRSFDSENDSRNVKIIFDKKSKKGFVYVRNKKVQKHTIPLIADYLDRKTITRDEYMARYFEAFCSPRADEFILSTFSKIYLDDDNIREILSTDRHFIEALKGFKDSFDKKYFNIISYPNFLF